jgi:DNA-binding IclR family transcriptional regulator
VPAQRVPSVERAFQILEVVAASPDGLPFSAIYKQTGCSKGTASARLAQLVRLRVLERVGQRYVLGSRMGRLRLPASDPRDVQEIAGPAMARLVEETGLTSHLGVLNGEELVVVRKLESDGFVRFSSYVGMVQPFYLSSMGKALFAFLPAEEADALAENCTFQLHTGRTISDAAALAREAQGIRRLGWALEDEESESGVRCIGAPIFDPMGKPIAAISVTATTAQLPPEAYSSTARHVLEAATAVSNLLGWRAPSPGDDVPFQQQADS